MKILHVIGRLDPSCGGPPRVAMRLAAGQAALGHEVTVVAYRLTHPEDFEAMTKRMPAVNRVQRVEIDHDGAIEKWFAKGARPILRERIAGAEIVHLHEIWDSLVLTASVEARRARKPYVIQPNDSLNPYALRHKGLKKQLALAVAFRRMIEGSSVALFGHSEEKRLVSQNGFRIHPVVAGLGGVFREEVEPLPQPGGFFQRVPQLRGRPFVVFLSRLNPKKGLDFLAEGFAVAARRVPDLQLVVIGHDEGAREDFERRIGRHGLADRVHLVGPMHGEAKWEAYRDALCFCLPSRDEAYTVAIIEAVACGLPVVISDACHFDDVGEYGSGLIVPLEPEKIGNALATVCSDPALRDRMSAAAQRLFVDRLCFNQVAREVVEIYEETLRAKRE